MYIHMYMRVYTVRVHVLYMCMYTVPIMNEPRAELSNTDSSDFWPHVLVAMDKHTGEESFHCVLELILVSR